MIVVQRALQEQYANDKQQLQQKMMELYKTEKINPLGGCLPILVQIPVFIALYWVLLAAVELRHAPWIGWIHDLALQRWWQASVAKEVSEIARLLREGERGKGLAAL